jgi:hypothetical protein
VGDEDAFMGGGAKTFPFDTVGDEVTGRILSIEQRQQTDMQTKEPAFWKDGKPKMMFTFTLQTKLREEEDDDGVRTINVRWKSQDAIKAAVKASGAKKPEVGGILTMKFTGEGVATERGFSKPKFWAAHYIPPDPSTGFMDDHDEAPRAQVGTREGVRQARNVDHYGQPQSQDAPAWAQPQARATDAQIAAAERLRPQGEREKFGY